MHRVRQIALKKAAIYRRRSQLKAQSAEFVSEADKDTTGPGNFIVVDPDGNPVLVDQHV